MENLKDIQQIAPNKTEEEYRETGKFIFHELAVWLKRNYIRTPRSENNKEK